MDFEIKKLDKEEIQLAKDLFIFYQVDDEVETPVVPSDEYLYNILSRDSFHVIVALQNNIVIGGLTAYELDMYKQEVTEVFLYEIAVHPMHKRKGVGTGLIKALKKICTAKCIKEIYVGAENDNDAAIEFYKKTGGNKKVIAWFEYDIE